MLFVGAGGLAAQLFEDAIAADMQDVAFWSEVETSNNFIKEKYGIINSDETVKAYFKTISKEFVLCIGDMKSRKIMAERFINLGGVLTTFISPFCNFSPYVKSVGPGTVILRGVDVEPGVVIGDLSLLNKYAGIGHSSIVGAFTTLGPKATLCGDIVMGDNCLVGIGSVIIEKIKIGNNVIIAAGAAVTKNIPDNAVVEGVPAAIRFYRK